MYVLFDIGGSKTRVAASVDGESLLGDPVIFDSTNEFDTDTARIIEEGRKIAGTEKVTGVAGGIAGVLDEKKRSLVRSPNKESWVGKPLADVLKEGFGAPVALENDTAVVALGEAHYGAGRDYGIVAYITVSTGVGGAKIENGFIDDRSIGFEPGHQYINTYCESCGECDNAPSVTECLDLEQLIGGRSVEKRTGLKPYEVTDEHEWHYIERWLAVGLNNTAVHWSPNVFVVGGSMVTGKLGKVIDLENVSAHLKRIMTIFPNIPDIRAAELGDFGGIYGALALVKQQSS